MVRVLDGAEDVVVILVLFNLTTSCYADSVSEK